MPALYSHTTRATGTVLTATIYNGDHQNHIDNGVPAQLDDYSSSVGQMQTITDPGGVGSESLPTSLAGELERIRFVLKSLSQGAQWYSAAAIAGLLNYSSVSGQRGTNNSGTPNTQYDFSADVVVLRSAAGGTVVRTSSGTVTNNVSTAGPAANGRDQAGAFSASSWIHFYWIWNGTTLATISSTVAPPTGPTLPTGYTHWAYICALRFNASSQLLRSRIVGNVVFYDSNDGDLRPVNNQTQTTFTAFSLTPYIPPNSPMVMLKCAMNLTHSVNAQFSLNLRPTGSGLASGMIVVEMTQTANTAQNSTNWTWYPTTGTSQQIDYKLNSAPNVTGGAFIDVLGYKVPNGDV